MGPGLVAVTGATGFLGRRLVAALMARHWRVRVLARRSSQAPWGQARSGRALWGAARPEIVMGDLEDRAALEVLTAGADALIHGAGLIKARSRAAFFAVNAEGSGRAAEAAGAARMILISSLSAREPSLSDYAASKRAGEDAARSVLGDRLTVMRPPAIYGPGDRETLGLFQLAGRSPLLPYPDAPAARLALAHVDDVAASLIERLEGAWTPGVFAIGGARPGGYGWREIFAAAAAAMGRAPTLAPVPGWLIKGAAAVSQTAARVRGTPAIFTPGKARELLHPDWSVSEAELAPGCFHEAMGLREGFAETVAWYRRERWLA